MRILIDRTENIGDLVVTIPSISLIKKYIPNAEVWFLARQYLQPFFEYIPMVDGVLNWDELKVKDLDDAAKIIREKQFDVFINMHAWPLLAKLAKKAAIPCRIGTGRRFYNWFYLNKLVWQRRKYSEFHEMQLCAQLLKPLGIPTQWTTKELLSHLKFQIPPATSLVQAALSANHFNLIIHPGSNGNGREWPPAYFAELIKRLDKTQFNIIITGGNQEKQKVDQLLQYSADITVKNLVGQTTLPELISLIASADGLISSGTGPVHLAAALETLTLGLYPPLKALGPERWRPIGVNADYLVQGKDCRKKCNNTDCLCMHAITVKMVQEKILSWLDNRVKKI